jgi:hypothetical protein
MHEAAAAPGAVGCACEVHRWWLWVKWVRLLVLFFIFIFIPAGGEADEGEEIDEEKSGGV